MIMYWVIGYMREFKMAATIGTTVTEFDASKVHLIINYVSFG